MDKTIAYSVPYPFSKTRMFNVIISANAWWMNQASLHRLVAAFSCDCTIPEACSYAEISVKQYKYFVEKHPEFNDYKNSLGVAIMIKARMTIIKNLDKDTRLAFKFLERMIPEEFGTAEQKRKARLKLEAQIGTELNADPRFAALREKYEKELVELILDGNPSLTMKEYIHSKPKN